MLSVTSTDMRLCSLFASIVFLMEVSGHSIPDGYILKVTPTCGASPSSDAYITVTTDLHAAAVAICSNNKVSFAKQDEANFHLDVSYPPSTKFPCVFQRKLNTSIYTLVVKVSWGEFDSPIYLHEDQFQVTCTFEKKKTQDSATRSIIEGLIAPKEIQSHVGPTSASQMTLKVCDVLGNQFKETALAIGRKVQLLAETDVAGGEKGIRPVHCDAVGVPNGKRYAVLRAGCGDGLVFKKTDGFQSRGLSSHSPYFELFDLPEEDYVKFECNFTMCEIECNGSSCTNARRRRDVETYFKSENDVVFLAESPPFLMLKSVSLIHECTSTDVNSTGVDSAFNNQIITRNVIISITIASFLVSCLVLVKSHRSNYTVIVAL